MEPGNESRDLPHIEAPSTPKTGTDADVARLIQNVGATSIAEFEKLIGELQEGQVRLVWINELGMR